VVASSARPIITRQVYYIHVLDFAPFSFRIISLAHSTLLYRTRLFFFGSVRQISLEIKYLYQTEQLSDPKNAIKVIARVQELMLT
jgi:hypothetical protein